MQVYRVTTTMPSRDVGATEEDRLDSERGIHGRKTDKTAGPFPKERRECRGVCQSTTEVVEQTRCCGI